MAEKMDDANTGEGNSPTKSHNFAKVADAITNAAEKLFEAEQKEKKAIIDHVKCFRDDKKRIKADLRADTEIETKYFSLFYNAYRAERLAKEEMEEDDRVRVMDSIAVVFDAFGQGSMLDCLVGFNEGKKSKPEKKSGKKKVDAKSPDNLPDQGPSHDNEPSDPEQNAPKEAKI